MLKTGLPNRILTALLCIALAAALAGCSRTSVRLTDEESVDRGVYRIYYMNSAGTGLVRHDYRPSSEDFEGILSELLTAFQTPDTTSCRSALPDNVKINSTVTGIAEIDVDFSSEYLSLDMVSEILLRSALVQTLLQLRGVDTVRFTVDSQSLVIGDEEIGPMSADTFIVPTAGAVNSYRNETLTLYFPNSDCSLLVPEQRKVYFSTNVNTAQMAVEQVISGPKDSSLLDVASDDVLVNSVSVRSGVCTVDFSAAINNTPFTVSSAAPDYVLYAFVNSIIDSVGENEISGVRFLIDGSDAVRFREQINLDQVFQRNADIIDAGDQQSQSAQPVEGAEPEETEAAAAAEAAG